MDLALDPFPYNGTTGSCETLWMGVPFIALAGRTHVARVGVSLLTRIGLERLVARDEEEYVALAVQLCSRPRGAGRLCVPECAAACGVPRCMDGRGIHPRAGRRVPAMWDDTGAAPAPSVVQLSRPRKCHSKSARYWAPIKSSPNWATGAWAKCIAPAIRGWAATWRSKFCAAPRFATPTRGAASRTRPTPPARLNHPNIVAVFDVNLDGENPYIVTELVEGESLRKLLQRGAVPLRKLVDIAVQVADGMAAAHQASIVHRDLKPENILLTRDGRAKIADFGLAKSLAPLSESGVAGIAHRLHVGAGRGHGHGGVHEPGTGERASG